MPLIRKNGKAYDSGDVQVSCFGYIEDEVEEISYETNQEHQLNHGLNNKARTWSRGKITDTCTITFPMTAIRRIERSVPGGNLLDIKPFDVNVSFVNEYNEIVNDTITCKFMKQGREVTGEMNLKKQYEMFVLEIKYGT